MTDPTGRLARVLEAIDAANARDPHLEHDTGTGSPAPAALLYGRRMSATLDAFAPSASEALAIAARGQHIERWTSPRGSYPVGRVGYLRWRTDLKAYHARRLAEIMAAQGYDEAMIARVGALVRKERLKQDPEAQTLEDVACLVFLKHYLPDFAAGKAEVPVDEDKLADILAKTWHKMSPNGQAAAAALPLPPRIPTLLAAGLARLDAAKSPA
jgi:Domain of unknown function (DUF4202)